MAYTKQTWADLPSKTTPINAERLTHIEDGIFNAAQTADTAASTAGTAAANVGIVSGRVETLTERVNGLDTAVSNKVDKVAGKGLSTNDYDDTDKGKVDSLGTASTKNSTSVVTESSDLVESGAVFDAVESAYQLVEDTVGWTGKNKFDSKQQFFVGFIDISNSKFVLQSGYYLGVVAIEPNTKYIITKQAGKTFRIALSESEPANNVSFRYTQADHTGSEMEITTGANDNYLSILFWSSANGDSGTYQQMADTIMVRDAKITDPTYEPYHASVEESLEQKCDNSVIGTVEDGTTASQAYAVGSHFIRDGAFCTVTQAISSGGTLTEGTNYTTGNVANTLSIQALTSADDLNNIKATGTYVWDNTAPTNVPSSQITYANMDVTVVNVNVIRQVIYHGSTGIYMRRYAFGTWGDWAVFTGTPI